jgi:hypothetical protein
MRLFAVLALFSSVVLADGVAPVPDDKAKEAIKEVRDAFRKAESVEEKQGVVFTLHDIPNDRTIRELKKYLRNRDPAIQGVAALALGGQLHNRKEAGELLLKTFEKEKDEIEVAISCIDAMKNLGWHGYWPALEDETGKGTRSAVVIRILELIGANKDYRALPMLLNMYKVAMPKYVRWTTGKVTVDTGAAGDTDRKAAEAKFNQKYGAGGSKARAAAEGKSKAFDARNFTTQIRKCVKEITGHDFETDIDLEDWWIENWELVARRTAELSGENVEKAIAKAKRELPQRKKEIAEARKKLEEELARREAEEAKKN